MAIGDNLNDLDMIKNSGVGVAVANAYDELKNVAKYTTLNPVEKGGFAEAIYKYIEF
jgi:hydroxymethylpyrimidine pyrophosphatase-like HAD family hydrolase